MLVLATAAFFIFPQIVAADAICDAHGSASFKYKKDLPTGAVAALFNMAEANEPFQAADVIQPGPRLPFRRFLSARQEGCAVTVKYEMGGIAHRYGSTVLDYADGKWVARPKERD